MAGCSFRAMPSEVYYLGDLRSGVRSALKLHFQSLRADVLLLYQPPGRLAWLLCALRWLTKPWNPRFVLVDIVFTKPWPGAIGTVVALLKWVLCKRVDLFISFIKDVSQLGVYYGIREGQCRFVPFKVNRLARSRALAPRSIGEYVFTGGRSRRDFSAFCRAMKDLPYPGIILTPRHDEALLHETDFDESHVPGNVRVVHDDGSIESWVGWIEGARIVVLVINEQSISPSGIGTYLEAMALGKCVVITECLATRAILHDGKEALVVRRGDPSALRDAIRRAWDDEDLCARVAETGRAYALSLGDERDLNQRFVDAVLDHFKARSSQAESRTPGGHWVPGQGL
ncbi:MAG: glycosyltransferase [Acidimicrobiia bacterium]